MLILNDNGTQLVGAERELREMIKGWKKEKLKEFAAEKGIKLTNGSLLHLQRLTKMVVLEQWLKGASEL